MAKKCIKKRDARGMLLFAELNYRLFAVPVACDVLNGFQNRMQTINNDLINSCKKTCYSVGGRHDRSVTYIP